MKNKVQSILIKIANKINPNHKYISERHYFAVKWKLDNGDYTKLIDYNLNNESVVFDVGGYQGNWSFEIYKKYGCYIHIFEPIEEYTQKIIHRFREHEKIKANQFGLSGKTREESINISEESSSVFALKDRSYNAEVILLKSAFEYISENNIETIELMKINIEGGEYELLNHLINTELINKITNLSIQFHSFIKNSEKLRLNLHKKLNKTHSLTYNYPFVWENWEKRK